TTQRIVAPKHRSFQRGAKVVEVERAHILRILKDTNWTISRRGSTAAHLGMKRTTLHSLMMRPARNRVSSTIHRSTVVPTCRQAADASASSFGIVSSLQRLPGRAVDSVGSRRRCPGGRHRALFET